MSLKNKIDTIKDDDVTTILLSAPRGRGGGGRGGGRGGSRRGGRSRSRVRIHRHYPRRYRPPSRWFYLPYGRRRYYYYPGRGFYYGGYGTGFLTGAMTVVGISLAAKALSDMTLDERQEIYYEETEKQMPSCGTIAENKYVMSKENQWVCDKTKDGAEICYYKMRKDDDKMYPCSVP